MNIFIDNKTGIPIYNQIYNEVKREIISGGIKEGELLPSIRNLSKDLRISVITTKRAYEELENEGFIMFLSCLSILLNKETLMFEASMPGKREKSIDARYILSLILIVFYSVLMYVIGLGERSVNQFVFEILLSMVLLSIEYPVIFLCSKKLHGLTTASIAALMILSLHLTNNNCPKESNISFVVWIIIGIVIFAVSRTITVKMYKKKRSYLLGIENEL